MTNKEAIERIKQNKAAAEFYAQYVDNFRSVENELKDIEAFDMAIKALHMAISALSADKVEVVRCKDCKWNTHYPFCDIDRDDDFFCADGQRE